MVDWILLYIRGHRWLAQALAFSGVSHADDNRGVSLIAVVIAAAAWHLG
jgi:hypothetical protein